MDERLHGLVGGLVRLLLGMLAHEVQNPGPLLLVGGGHHGGELLSQGLVILGISRQAGLFARLLLQLL